MGTQDFQAHGVQFLIGTSLEQCPNERLDQSEASIVTILLVREANRNSQLRYAGSLLCHLPLFLGGTCA
jgi:hypothetical protein